MPFEQVDEPSWRRDHDVNVTDAGDLVADRHAPVDGGDADAYAAAQRGERVGDLLGEFAGRDQDQAAGGLGVPRAGTGREPGQQGEAEGQGLARSGLSAAEYVTAGQRVGKGPGLDRERLVDVTRRERAHQPVVQPEFGERGRRRLRRRGGGVEGLVKLGIRFGTRGPWTLRVPGCGWAAASGAALSAPAVTGRRRARTPGTMGHAENSIVVQGSHARQTSKTNGKSANAAGLFAATSGLPARGSGGENRRLRCKTISRVRYSPPGRGWTRRPDGPLPQVGFLLAGLSRVRRLIIARRDQRRGAVRRRRPR